MAVSTRDVAAAASVSVGTVSNVLNRPSKVAPETVERVMQAIENLGFVRNYAARQLRVGHSRSIGLVVLDVGNPFFIEVARGADERAAEAGMTVLLANSDERADREDAYLELFLEQRVNGVLVTPVRDDLTALERLQEGGTRVILVDREVPGSDFGSVSVDDVKGGRLAVAHLTATGHRRIAFIGGPLTIRQVADRLEGARRAIEESPSATLEVIEMSALSVIQGREAAEWILARGRSEWPDAVFAANDLLAVGVLQAFSLRTDVRVPQDIALIGYDDIDFASTTVVPLSSMRQPAHLIGYTAVDLLLSDADPSDRPNGRSVRFQPELVARESTLG